MKRKRSFFAEQIRKILFEKNLTQEDLGNLIGVKRPMISQWVSGARNISLNSLKRISQALNIPLNYLIDENNSFKETKNNEEKILNSDINSKMSLLEEKNKTLEEKIKRLETENNLLKKEIELIKIKLEKN